MWVCFFLEKTCPRDWVSFLMGTFSPGTNLLIYECSDRLGKRGLMVTCIYKCIKKISEKSKLNQGYSELKKKISSSRAPPYWLLFCSIKLTHSLNCLLSINSINNFPSFQWTVSKFNENN